MTYAIIEAGGKQHRVQPGEVLKVEKIEVATGETISFDKVLLVSIDGNLKIGKFRRRKHHLKQAGHRQWYTAIKITDIKA
jgi:large subunit ribosomal protein L21